MGQPLSPESLDTIFRKARSYNGYVDRPVDKDLLHQIWDLMKMGPTSANCLPARMIWCTSQEAKDKLATHASGTNGPKIKAAPVTVILGYDPKFYDQLPELFPPADARSWFTHDAAVAEATAFRNSSLQGAYLIIAARALGLDTGPMSGFDTAGVNATFFAESGFKANFIATLGYGDPATIFDRLPRPGFERFNSIA